MRRSLPFIGLFASLVAAGTVVSVFGVPSPPTTPASASAYASASASLSASASASTGAKLYEPPPGPPVAPKKSAWVPPTEKTERPDDKDWARAAALELPRNHFLCHAQTIREWVRVECKRDAGEFDPFMGLRVVGGSHEDVAVSNPITGEMGHRPLAVVFPVRKGDRRMIEFAGAEMGGWKDFNVYERLDFALSEEWLEGEVAPTITVD